jgi:hypothetical protein
MRNSVLLIPFALLVVTPRCAWGGAECSTDSDCDDFNECTDDDCKYSLACLDEGTFHCKYSDVADGTPCDADGESGVCVAGECRLDDETSEPILDGGV